MTIHENTELIPEESGNDSVESTEMETTETVVPDIETEGIEENESELSNEEDLVGTVSGGDSADMEQIEAGITSDIIEVVLSAEQNELFERNNELLEQLVEAQTNTIVDKPLAQYTPTEGMLLILLVFALGIVLGRIIGGILPCRQ